MVQSKTRVSILILMLVHFVSHLTILKKDLTGVHLWRQTQTQHNIQNFYRQDNSILNPRYNHLSLDTDSDIIRMEFPVMQWLIAQMYRVFGESILLTRLCMLFFGFVGVYYLFRWIFLFTHNNIVSFSATLCFVFSPVFFYYTANPLPDIFALSTGIAAMYYFFHFVQYQRLFALILAAIFFGLSVLSKLPFVIYGSVFAVYFFYFIYNKNHSTAIKIATVFILFLLPAIFWYKWVIPTWGGNPIVNISPFSGKYFAKAKPIALFHLKIMFPEMVLNYFNLVLCLLAIVFLLIDRRISVQRVSLFSGLLFCFIYWVIELIPIDIVHDYYMLPFLPFLFVLIAYALYRILPIQKYLWVAVLLTPALCYHSLQGYWSMAFAYTNNDIFIHKDELRNIVPRKEKCIIMNDISCHVYPYFFDKKGYLFNEGWLPYPELWNELIDKKNVKYLYSDNRAFEEREYVKSRLDSLLLRAGSINVYKLR